MREKLGRLLDSPRVTVWAAAISLALGLFFTFVWPPHPWGWTGIDQYHELARALARGEPFGTTDVPWGYAYFVAALYTAFGERAWIPVTVQAFANASVPVMLYHLVLPLVGQRTAALASLLVGVFSFNTVYASTQASDAICTVLFIASLLCYAKGYQTERSRYFLLSGALLGLVAQFRPNMILFPFVLAAAALAFGAKTARTAKQVGIFLAFVVLALSPWVVRNYRLTSTILPTSTHGGVQLWYGSLQVGPYLESRAYNPRSAFEPASFDYTSIAGQPLVVTAHSRACVSAEDVSLVYWTDRDLRRISTRAGHRESDRLMFEIPGQAAPTTIYYFFQAGDLTFPEDGSSHPLVYFVSSDHLGDLDRHGDLLDVFDIIRLMRQVAGRSAAEADLKEAVVRLLGGRATLDVVSGLDVAADAIVLRLADGSRLTVPKSFSGRVTDVEVQGALARALIPAHKRIAEAPPPPPGTHACLPVGEVRVNDVFYRREPHEMRRYVALALDNISRDPLAFAAASAYRAVRLFVVRGVDDRLTAQQFSGSQLVYLAGFVLSVSYLLLFLAGVAIAWRRRQALVLLLLLPIAYVPLTICFVLTNMRYTITVQPLMFTFVALAILAAAAIPARGA